LQHVSQTAIIRIEFVLLIVKHLDI
jgi:hypothetical protein